MPSCPGSVGTEPGKVGGIKLAAPTAGAVGKARLVPLATLQKKNKAVLRTAEAEKRK